tara:strand:+ start:3023 stop:3400 length:378 start_codon:yes stop_codon:yes gene_type:complete
MNNKNQFIRIDGFHCFKIDEIIGFKSIGGDNGEHDKICNGDYDSYIKFYFKNGTNILVSFGDDEGCNKWRDAYITYLEEIFSPYHQKDTDRLNQIIREQNPEDYKYLEEDYTKEDWAKDQADPKD